MVILLSSNQLFSTFFFFVVRLPRRFFSHRGGGADTLFFLIDQPFFAMVLYFDGVGDGVDWEATHRSFYQIAQSLFGTAAKEVEMLRLRRLFVGTKFFGGSG